MFIDFVKFCDSILIGYIDNSELEDFRMDVTEFAHEGTVDSVSVNGVTADRVVIKHYGIKGDDHAREDRSYIPQHGEPWQAWWHESMKGTVFFNWRTWTAISAEERNNLAGRLGMEEIKPGGLFENFVFSGIPGFSKLPPGTHLIIYNDKDAPMCVLVVHDQNFPCTKTAKHLYDSHGCTGVKSEFASTFKEQGKDLRGIMGYVVWPGDSASAVVTPGNKVRVWLPVNAHHKYT